MPERFEDNTPSKERVAEVGEIINGLLAIVKDNGLKEVESAQPENLHQWEAEDSNGNNITYIRDVVAGHLQAPIEVRDSKGKLIAQSSDEGKNWSVDRYIENGVDFSV